MSTTTLATRAAALALTGQVPLHSPARAVC